MNREFIYDFLRRHASYKTRKWLRNRSWFAPVTKALFGYSVYCKSYYSDQERMEAASGEVIADWVVKNLNPARVIDVGCGAGVLLQELQKRHVAVLGVDVSEAAGAMAKAKGVPFKHFDLTAETEPLPGGPYDLAISCEVAEHLEPAFAKPFVRKMTQAAPCVYLTAAEPKPDGDVGLHHFNEQPNEYWIDLMRQEGFELDPKATSAARETFASRDVINYLARPMIFLQKRIVD
jgi:SAM-dependent methyltransferase